MASKIAALSLEELYAKEKITPSVEKAILEKEDFSKISPQYCERVCKLNCKSSHKVVLLHTPVDVMIIQDTKAIKDGNISAETKEQQNQRLINHLINKHFTPHRVSARIVNLFKCQIQDEDIRKGKPPTSSVIRKCSPYLKGEIERCKPKVIICLGNEAAMAAGAGRKSVHTHRGEIFGNIILTLHPKVATMIRQNASGKSWGPDYFDLIDRDFEKASRMARGLLKVPTIDEGIEKWSKNVHICRTLEEVEHFCDQIMSLPENAIISYDLETTSLDPWIESAKILTAQFGYKDASTNEIVSFVVTLWHRDNDMYDPDEAWNYIAPIISDASIYKVGHNIKFDTLYTYATKGVRVRGIKFDTMLLLHGINSGVQGNYGLKKAVWDFWPESGLGGYEDLLPSLTKKKDSEDDDEDDSEEGGTNE